MTDTVAPLSGVHCDFLLLLFCLYTCLCLLVLMLKPFPTENVTSCSRLCDADCTSEVLGGRRLRTILLGVNKYVWFGKHPGHLSEKWVVAARKTKRWLQKWKGVFFCFFSAFVSWVELRMITFVSVSTLRPARVHGTCVRHRIYPLRKNDSPPSRTSRPLPGRYIYTRMPAARCEGLRSRA